jgi:hypothetical protein
MTNVPSMAAQNEQITPRPADEYVSPLVVLWGSTSSPRTQVRTRPLPLPSWRHPLPMRPPLGFTLLDQLRLAKAEQKRERRRTRRTS